MASLGYCGSSFRSIMACFPCNQLCAAASAAALVSGYSCASSMPLRKLRQATNEHAEKESEVW